MFKLCYWLLSIMRIEIIVFLALFIGLGCMLIYYWDFAIGLSLFMIGLIVLFILMFIKLYSIITNFIEDLSSKGCD